MNWERGFRRIALLLCIVVALGCGILSGGLTLGELSSDKQIYDDYQDDFDNISYFWLVWDVNGWSSGKKGVIRYLLDNKEKYSDASFSKGGDETFYLSPDDVFPGIGKDMLDMPPDVLSQKCKEVKKQAFEKIQNQIKSFEKCNRTFTKIASMSIGVGIFFCAIGFTVIWLVYLLLRWLVLGFCGKPKDEPKQ